MNSPASATFKKNLLSWVKSILLTLLSVVLLTLSFPNFNGFYLAFIALVPLFIIIERKSFLQALFCLELFVVLFYGYLMWWVDIFHPLALPGLIFYLCLIYVVPFAIYRAIRGRYTHVYDPLLLAILFTLLEYARGLGFPRFQYGAIAYSQYSFLPFIQISEITGFLGVSFLLYLTNSFIAHLLSQLERLELKAKVHFKSLLGAFSYIFFNRIWIIIIILSLNLIYGFTRLNQIRQSTPQEQKPFNATLIQPWFDYNITENRLPILTQKLFKITEASLHISNETSISDPLSTPDNNLTPTDPTTSENTPPPPQKNNLPPPDDNPNHKSQKNIPDLIVWPESAIDVYYKYELDNIIPNKETLSSPTAAYTKAIYDFLRTLGAQYNTTFLAGGFSLEPITKIVTKSTPSSSPEDEPATPTSPDQNDLETTAPDDVSKLKNPELETITIGYEKYNAALLIDTNGLVSDWSGKVHLVPFAEYFPYTHILEKFPFLHQVLKEARASQFTPYNQYKVFDHNNVPFSVLICYDDTFSDLSRTFTIAGAQFLIVITNDAWSYSERSQNIHYAFSLFRAIENRRPILRVGNAGVTALIDPQGRAHHSLPMFEEGFASVSFYPQSNVTFFTSFGDWFIFLLAFVLILFVAPFTISRYFIGLLPRIIKLFSPKKQR
ncbi:apolipoprotein N-acyltransferase [Spirochaetota bacterium]|nr:apolipoprotein N-acyltransferase [Spirochaetota bacterium]